MKKYLLLLLVLMTGAAFADASGLNVGDKTPAHHPQHVTGPDAGTDTCPV
ncbi:unnamed protein product [Phaeothamnion confervicola]